MKQKHKRMLENVFQIASEHLQGLEVKLYLFGSWAKGTQQTSSDIDIAVVYENELPTGCLTKLRMAFDDSTIPYRVEVVDLTKTDPAFTQKVQEEGIEWNACDNV